MMMNPWGGDLEENEDVASIIDSAADVALFPLTMAKENVIFSSKVNQPILCYVT